MTFSKDTTLTEATRLVRRFALVWTLCVPLIGTAALDTPQRPASVVAARSSPAYSGQHKTRTENATPPRTYLALVGPTAIRFANADPVLPAEPSLPPPRKAKTPLPPEAQQPVPGKNQEGDGTKDGMPKKPDLPPESAGDAVSEKPVSILPDDTRTEIKPEDVLPFFQFPNGSDGGAMAIPLTVPQTPAANTVPPSSATYRQQ